MTSASSIYSAVPSSYPSEQSMTDYELITACLQGKQEYFTELVRRYKNLVYSIILRMINDSEEANDLAQDVFVKVYRNLEKYYPDFKFSTWIMRITTNHVIDYRRKKHQDVISIEEVDYEIKGETSPDETVIRKEQTRMLKEVVDQLPDMYKIPIVLYHQQGLSYQEISDVIEEPLSKVKNRIFRGRKMLKENLMRIGGGERYELQ